MGAGRIHNAKKKKKKQLFKAPNQCQANWIMKNWSGVQMFCLACTMCFFLNWTWLSLDTVQLTRHYSAILLYSNTELTVIWLHQCPTHSSSHLLVCNFQTDLCIKYLSMCWLQGWQRKRTIAGRKRKVAKGRKFQHCHLWKRHFPAPSPVITAANCSIARSGEMGIWHSHSWPCLPTNLSVFGDIPKRQNSNSQPSLLVRHWLMAEVPPKSSICQNCDMEKSKVKKNQNVFASMEVAEASGSQWQQNWVPGRDVTLMKQGALILSGQGK